MLEIKTDEWYITVYSDGAPIVERRRARVGSGGLDT